MSDWHYPNRKDEEHYWATRKAPRVDSGTPYQVTQDELDELRYAHEREYRQKHDRHSQSMNISEATSHLENTLACALSEDEKVVAARIKTAFDNPAWTVDLITKAFNDIDLVCFDRRLKGRTRIAWNGSVKGLTKTMGRNYPGTLGITDVNSWRSVLVPEITLNAYTLFMLPTRYSKRREVWSTLMHEMIVSAFPPLQTLHCFSVKQSSTTKDILKRYTRWLVPWITLGAPLIRPKEKDSNHILRFGERIRNADGGIRDL